MSGPSARVEPQYIRFPPKWQNVLLPAGPRRVTAAGMMLYTASRPRPLVAQRVLWALARLGGSRLVPGRRETWTPSVGADVFDELCRQWARVAGPAEGMAVYHRLQATRPGLVLLFHGRRRRVVVRLRRDPGVLVQERHISEAATAMRPAHFRVPRVLGSGEHEGWHWSASEAIARWPHAPARRLTPGAAAEITELVERVVPRPPGTPPSWRGAHGDLTPWNMRRAGGRTWLFDWEDAGWEPPGSDAVYFAATSAALRRSEPSGPLEVGAEHREARARWALRVAERDTVAEEAQLRRRLGVLLAEEPR